MKVLLSLLILLAYSSLVAVAQLPSSPVTQNGPVDPFIREHSDRRAKNPEGLSFTVRLKENKKQFYPGEIITLELSFAASKPKTFTVDAATYDRSGRLFSDGFVLDQQDAAPDPLKDYFQSGLNGFMIGGLRSIPELTERPYVITADLNEWRRIDKSGHYRMYVVSNRVGTKGASFLTSDVRGVVSNVIEFDVLPQDAKWAKQKLKEAVSALSKADGDRNAACRILRFLGTTAAVTELRKRFRGDDTKCEWEYKFGLIGSPHRDLVIQEMENAISLREQPVTSHFISTLALLEFTKRAGAEPPFVEGKSEEWEAQRLQRSNLYDELQLHYVRQLVIAIPQKQGEARAASLKTLLDYRREFNESDLSQWKSLLAALPEVFNRLPLSDQLRLLEYQWKPIASTAMVPVLREVLNYRYKPVANELDEPFDQFQREKLHSIAVRRLYELSPEEGRRLILEDLRRRKPRLDREARGSLPDETLPELNAELATNLEESRQSGNYFAEIAELIERYATDEILSRVRTVYDIQHAGRWECRAQSALLAYFLRVAPPVGGEYLKKALARRDRGYLGCHREMLKGVADLHMSSELEDAATAALDDEDAQVVSQAASVLAQYGSAEAETALWTRLEKWHKAVQGQSEEESQAELDVDQKKIEEALREALTKGNAWFTDRDKLKRVRDLCLTDKGRADIDSFIGDRDYQIYIDLESLDVGTPIIGVAQYPLESLDSLKKKLLQFPKGTTFKFKTAPPRGYETLSEELFQKIKGYLEEHGMNLKRATEQ